MAPAYQPDFLAAAGPILEAAKAMPKPPRHDVATRRAGTDAGFTMLMSKIPRLPGVSETVHHVTTADGYSLAIHEFRPTAETGTTPGPAVFYLHGGGFVALSVEIFTNHINNYAALSQIPFFAVEYRLAPEHPYPTPFEDTYTGLTWLSSNASKFNVDPSRIGLVGESAGGNLAAALAIAARDRKLTPPIKHQLLVYPMLDDRTDTPNPYIEPLATYNTEDNITSWTAYLGPTLKPGSPHVPATAAPARLTDFSNLPATYIDTTELDIFRDEDTAYAQQLWKAGISCEFSVHLGVPHGFEIYAPEIDLVSRAVQARLAALKRL